MILRLFFRYDYEGLDVDTACEMMEDLEILITDKSFAKQRFAVEDKIYQVEKADSFEYTDPVTSILTRNQVTPHTLSWSSLPLPLARVFLENVIKSHDTRCALLIQFQGLRIIFSDGSRIVYRLSGTRSSGATVQIYIDSREMERLSEDTQVKNWSSPVIKSA